MTEIAQRVETVEPEVIEHAEQPEPETTQEITEKPLEMSNYIEELWELGEAKDHFEMPSLTKEINDFVLSEIERRGLESNRESYKEVVEAYEKRLNLPKGIDKYTKTEQIIELMRIDKRLLEAAKAKDELLKKPITELTSKQLRDRIEGK